MRIDVEEVTALVFDDGAPVRAASAVERLGDGWLVISDDSTHAAWWHDGGVRPVRLLPPVEGHELFDEASGTKHLKPDLEAACSVVTNGPSGVLALGSGSSPRRMRGALVLLAGEDATAVHADLAPLYDVVADALSVAADDLNLEGACAIGPVLRWFHRGLPAAGSPSASVDLELEALVRAVQGEMDPADVAVRHVRRYDLGMVDGVGLAVTDAVALSSRSGAEPVLLVSAAAEDTPDPRDDGPVVGSALVLLEGSDVVGAAPLPPLEGRVCKVEGLAVVEESTDRARVLATVDSDDHLAPSVAVRLGVRW